MEKSTAAVIGAMPIPADFKYKGTYQKGRPQHEKYSDFWRKHIPMDPAHRAKIFAPFDALDGFDEGITAKEIVYCPRREMDEELLDRELRNLTAHDSPVTISYFVPCEDPCSDAFDLGLGRYESITGTVDKIDRQTQTIAIAGKTICFEDIADIGFLNSR